MSELDRLIYRQKKTLCFYNNTLSSCIKLKFYIQLTRRLDEPVEPTHAGATRGPKSVHHSRQGPWPSLFVSRFRYQVPIPGSTGLPSQKRSRKTDGILNNQKPRRCTSLSMASHHARLDPIPAKFHSHGKNLSHTDADRRRSGTHGVHKPWTKGLHEIPFFILSEWKKNPVLHKFINAY